MLNKEELNMRLLLVTVLKDFRFIIYGFLLGGMIFVALYYMGNHVFNGGEDYESRGMIAIDYADDVEKAGIYLNDLTWYNLAASDMVFNKVLPKAGTILLRDEMEASITATLESDIRILVIKATTKDPDLSREICQAYLDAFVEVQDQFEDIDSLTIIDNAKYGVSKAPDKKLVNVGILGAIIGSLLSLGSIVLMYVFNDSIVLPHTIVTRLGAKPLGVIVKDLRKVNFESDNIFIDMPRKTAKVVKFELALLKDNMRSVFESNKKVLVMDIELNEEAGYVVDVLKYIHRELFVDYRHLSDRGEIESKDDIYEKDDMIISYKSVIDNPIGLNEMIGDEKIILLIKASATSSALVETILDHVKGVNADLAGIILYDADTKLISNFLFPKFKKQS